MVTVVRLIGQKVCVKTLITLDIYGSIINVGVTPLRCHFQHYFFCKKISIQDSHTLQ